MNREVLSNYPNVMSVSEGAGDSPEAALKFVDEVLLLPPMKSDVEYAKLVTDIHPAIIAVTEGDPMIEKKQAHASLVGAIVVTIPKIHTPSTSTLAKLLDLE